MDRDQDNFQTPSRLGEDKDAAGTTAGGASRYQKMVESKYELNEHEGNHESDRKHEDNETADQLDSLEKEIKECGKRLEEIHYEMLKQTDKYSDNYLELEQERKELRKRVMDLDYQHRVVCAGLMKESRRKEVEERDRLIQESEERRKKQKEQFEERLKKDQEEREKSRHKSGSGEEEKAPQAEGENKEGSNEQETELERSRRKLRIAEIESELAASRLRRSRIAILNSELDYLRSTYSYPYWSWRDYYPYYSSLAYPSSLYPSSLYYPYTPAYSYPLTYPYGYSYLGYRRWWL